MHTDSYLRHLLNNEYLLRSYYDKQKSVSLEEVKRTVLLMERMTAVQVPDHYYRLGVEQTFEKIEKLSQLFTIGLTQLSENFLEIRKNKVYVQAEKQTLWQLLLPSCPPLIMVCAKLWYSCGFDPAKALDYLYDWLLPNVAYTALPSPYLPRLEELKETGGCTDLHLHLNGALETDLTWQDFLTNPMEVLDELNNAFNNERVKEQYLQFSTLRSPEDIYELLRVAGVLRELLYAYLFNDNKHKLIENGGSFDELLIRIRSYSLSHVVERHPESYISKALSQPLCLEGLFYLRMFHYLSSHLDNDTVSGLFLYYLSILGLCNRMLVHQTSSYGFQEFQKITLNGFREYSERYYNRRFLQMSGNDLKNIKYLEGRFSPKDSQNKNEQILSNVLEGWKQLQARQTDLGLPVSSLNLVAHFIKKVDKHPDERVRYRQLRQDLSFRTDLLIQLLQDKSELSGMITGIDAAASEFDTPPEVFAPSYRKLRKAGYGHFTYHAGEDFYHVLSGLRAIYEAIMFLDLQRTDRIGHAVAAGVPVGIWRENIGNYILIRKGEWLDNLVFAFNLISNFNLTELTPLLPLIQLQIEKYGFEIYKVHVPVSLYVDSWLSRYRDPEQVLSKSIIDFNDINLDTLFARYHSREVSNRYNEIIRINTFELFGEKELTQLQKELLAFMHQKEIVIETLPTSNVMIGTHREYATYHLHSWYKWKKEGLPLPPIIIGSDDAGIFATNIYNEYCNIYCQFFYDNKMNAEEIISFIRELDDNSRLYAFCKG